jgi:magnesium-transporting ATPase (P-type)
MSLPYDINEQSDKIHPILLHCVLSSYLFASERDLQHRGKNPEVITLIFGFLQVIFVSFLFSLVILGINDGPEVVSELLKGNLRFHTGFFMGYAIYPLILLTFGTMIIMCVIPFMITSKVLKNDSSVNNKAILLASFYGLSSILLFVVLVPTIAWISVWTQPQMIQLQPSSWAEVWWYAIGGLILIALMSNFLCLRKMLGLKKEEAVKISIILLLVIGIIFSLFFIF